MKSTPRSAAAWVAAILALSAPALVAQEQGETEAEEAGAEQEDEVEREAASERDESLAAEEEPGEGASEPAAGTTPAGCVKDTDCKGERVCEQGSCVSPPRELGCVKDVDCKGERICEGGRCVRPVETEEEQQPTEDETGEDGVDGQRFMDTRITFVFSDDNLLAGTKERSPSIGIGPADDELFFEGLQQEKRGWETETQLVLYKKMPSYFPRLDAEAALVLEMQNFVDKDTWENETVIGDDGSYLKLNLYTERDDYTGDNVNLTLFPMDSQRFLLGYTYDITWGGERIFPNKKGQVPGARLKWDFNVGEAHSGYVFAGAKTARLLNNELNEQQTYYGALGGFGIEIIDWLFWEANGGYFQRGPFLTAAGTSLGGETMESYGGSTRLTLHQGLPIGTSVDFRLYRVAPDPASVLTAEQQYDSGFSWSLSGEYTCVAQSLLSFEEAEKSIVQPAMASSAIGKLRFGKLRVHADFIFRNPHYVVFNVPGVFPYRAFPEGADLSPEWFVAGGLDYYFEKARLTPGIIFGYKQPATMTTDDSDMSTVVGDWPTLGAGRSTLVIRSEDDWEILPAGESAFDIISAKLTLKWDVAPFFVVLGELRYTLDKNRTKYVRDVEHESTGYKKYEDDNVTNRLGFALLAQAKW